MLLEERFGDPEALLERSMEEQLALGVPKRLARALTSDVGLREAEAELREHQRLEHRLCAFGEDAYPDALSMIEDPPQVLSYRGEPLETGPRTVAIVGARRATREGLDVAYHLGLELAAAGVTVVSGLARGVDTAAHEGALDAGGRTIAVLGSGLAEVYPKRNRGLADRIVRRGGSVVSELAPAAPPRRHTFPQRNRIVTGMSWGVVVVQAGPRSGALLSAELALQQGRELFAVPGSIRQPLAQGTNDLLKDGARLVTCARDVLDVLDGVSAEPDPPAPVSDAARHLLTLLSETERDELELIDAAGLEARESLTALGELLVWGLARRTPRGYALR